MAPTPSPPASPPLPAGPAPPLPDSDNTPKRSGKNLGWSQLELLALAETAPTVLEDAAVGNGQTAVKMGMRIRARFVERAPVNNGTETGTGSELDTRRWLARTGRACKKRWDMVKVACTVYEQAVDFVTAARVTGNPKPEELQRCHLACYNTHQDGKGMGSRTKHLTAIAMDKHYPVGDPFEFFHCWEYLSENTNLLVTGAVIGDPVAEVGAGGAGGDGQAAAPPVAGPPVVGAADAAPPRQERPQGVKAAKVEKGRKRKLNGTDDGEDKEASAIIARMDKIADSLDMEAKRKKESDQHHRRVQADKLALGASNALYAGVTLTLPQRVTALNELRKQYLHEAAGVVEDGGERGRRAGAGDGTEASVPAPSSPDVTRESDRTQ